MFYTGQKIVCVNDDIKFSNNHLKPGGSFMGGEIDWFIKVGDIYTVRKCFEVIETETSKSFLGVYLFEHGRDFCPRRLIETPYAAERFRPVQDKKTDISLFTEMLHTTKEDA